MIGVGNEAMRGMLRTLASAALVGAWLGGCALQADSRPQPRVVSVADFAKPASPPSERHAALLLRNPGDRIIVNSLVGQINGRPIYADEFFAPINDKLLADRQQMRGNPVEFVKNLDFEVSSHLNNLIMNELLIADAYATLKPEQKQGLFGLLGQIQEEAIAGSGGGVRHDAEALWQSGEGITLDQLQDLRKNQLLMGNLLRSRIEPRVVVAWRDIELEYQHHLAEFNPPQTITIGSIRLDNKDETATIAEVKRRFADGATFAAVVEHLQLPNGGKFMSFPSKSPDPADITDLLPEFKVRLAGFKIGQWTEAFEFEGNTYWLAVLDVDQPPGRSIYDVQIEIERALRDVREQKEINRYVAKLRQRWVSDDLEAMRRRIIEIARERYLR
jgi:hypothetical protein